METKFRAHPQALGQDVNAESAVEIAGVGMGLAGLDHDLPQGQVPASGLEREFVQDTDGNRPGSPRPL